MEITTDPAVRIESFMRHLARWTIGPVSDTGFDILKESLRLFSAVYPEFDRVICYNHIPASRLEAVKNWADLYEQKLEDVPCCLAEPDDDPEAATGCGWKLSPPRLRPDALELFIDNDIVIRQRLEAIDHWMALGDCGLVAEGLGLHRLRMFGVFDPYIHRHIRACAGLFGLPPGFDFAERIKYYSQFMEGQPLGGYDEQGLTVATVVNMPNYVLVPLTQLAICEDQEEGTYPEFLPPAIHFVAANRKPWHRGWKAYRRARTLMI